MSILKTNHSRLQYDERYSAGEFDTFLNQRIDVTKEIEQTFAELMTLICGQGVRQCEYSGSLMEKGIALEGGNIVPRDKI